MSSDHFDTENYQISRQKALSAHIDNLANGTDAGFKRMPQPRTDTGVVNAYVITIDDGPDPYDGYVVIFKPTNTNTSASTLTLNSEAAAAIVNSDGTALSGGELVADHNYMLTYNGGSYEIVSSSIPPGSITEEMVELNGTKTDGYVWAWNAAAGKMEWVAQGAGADSGQVRLEDASSPFAYLGDVISSDFQITSGNLELQTEYLPLTGGTLLGSLTVPYLITEHVGGGDIVSLGSNLLSSVDSLGQVKLRWKDNGSGGFDSNLILSGDAVSPYPTDTIDLGSSAGRFWEIYAYNGTINTSDERDKDFSLIENAEWLYLLSPIKYTWKDKPFTGTRYGFSAQDTYDKMPDKTANVVRKPDSPTGTWGMQQELLIAPMLKLIQEQKKLIDDLSKRITVLEQ